MLRASRALRLRPAAHTAGGVRGALHHPKKPVRCATERLGAQLKTISCRAVKWNPGACMQVVCVMLSAVQRTCAPAGQQSPPAQAQSASAGPVLPGEERAAADSSSFGLCVREKCAGQQATFADRVAAGARSGMDSLHSSLQSIRNRTSEPGASVDAPLRKKRTRARHCTLSPSGLCPW